MRNFTPIVTTRSEVKKGDLHIFQFRPGVWSSPMCASHDGNDDDCAPAVILDRTPPWPTAPIIRILSGTADNRPIEPGTLAIRGSVGYFCMSSSHEDDMYLTKSCEFDWIDDWESIPAVSATQLATLLANINGHSVDLRLSEAAQRAHDALGEVMGE